MEKRNKKLDNIISKIINNIFKKILNINKIK